jgi:hypothetical protein
MPAAQRPRLTEAAVRVVRFYEDRPDPGRAAAWKAKVGLSDLPADLFAPPRSAPSSSRRGRGHVSLNQRKSHRTNPL